MNTAIQEIKSKFPSLQFGEIELPKGHSLNDMLVNYGPEAIYQLLQESKAIEEGCTHSSKENAFKSEIKPLKKESEPGFNENSTQQLVVYNGQKIGYQGQAAFYYVLGSLSGELGSLQVTIQLEQEQTGRRQTRKLDLFEHKEVQAFCVEMYEKEGFNANAIESDIMQLAELLTDYRDEQIKKAQSGLIANRKKPVISPSKENEAVQFLIQKDLIKQLDRLIAQSGVIGEENNRILLFICASTFKTNPLHVLVQGTSGSGKSHLINAIKDCLPGEEVINLTRVTSKSFYHYQGDELVNKLIVIQDFDGLDEEAQLAFREAQSAKYLSSSTVFKDKFGNLQSIVRNVNAHFSSMVATTKAEVYFDNMSRSVIVGVDESEEQTRNIISYQNKKIAGLVDLESESKARELLQNCVRMLKPYKVINRYADKIQLPMEAKMLRRLNEQFQLFVIQVTYLHQYQRELDKEDRIIATPEDLRLAVDLFFDSIWLKIDELDASTRQFFERMKEFIKKRGTDKPFSQREVRQALNQSKTQCFRYFEELQKLEYIQVTDGTANRGYQYRITEWKPIQDFKEKIKKELYKQLESL